MASVSYVTDAPVPKAPGPSSGIGSSLKGLATVAGPFIKDAAGDKVIDLANDKLGGKTGAAAGKLLTGGVANIGGNLANLAGAFASDKLKGSLDKLANKKGFKYLAKALGIGATGSTDYQRWKPVLTLRWASISL
jgi:hypothetical protein